MTSLGRMESFDVILEGQCLAGFDPAKVRTALAKLVGQTEAVAGQLLAGREVVVKSRVDIVTSTRYVEALHAIGVASRVAPEVLEIDDELAVRLMNARPPIAVVGSERSRAPDTLQLPRSATPPQHRRSTSKKANAFGWLLLFGIPIAVSVGLYTALTSSARTGKDVSAPVSAAAPAQQVPVSAPALAAVPVQQVPGHGIHDPFAGISRSSIGGMGAIVLDGEISRAMAAEFDLTFREMRAEQPKTLTVVWLNSKGGDLSAAMEIGRSIRNDEGGAVGVREHDVCFSSCVFILAAGKTRFRLGRIGIHRPYLVEPISDGAAVKRWFERLSTDAKTYLREMNVRESLFDDMVSIPPEDIHIFQSWEEMDRYGLLAVDPVTAEQIAAGMMRRYGINSKSLFYERKQQVDRECKDGNEYLNCMEHVMRGVGMAPTMPRVPTSTFDPSTAVPVSDAPVFRQQDVPASARFIPDPVSRGADQAATDLHKCKGKDGRVLYANAPCPVGTGQTVVDAPYGFSYAPGR